MSKKKVHTLIKKYFIAKNVNHHLSLQHIIVATKITYHHNKYSNSEKVCQELPKCGTETRSEQMLLEKWHQ